MGDKSLHWVLARAGGFDGVSLQTFEYAQLLNYLGIHINIITGYEETKYGSIKYNSNEHQIIDNLKFNHPDTAFLYNSSLIEKNSDISNIEWTERLGKQKLNLKKDLKQIILNDSNPVIVHNLLSLRHLHPAAALALNDIIDENPQKKFLNFAPDSDWERSNKMAMMNDRLKKSISRTNALDHDSSGPYDKENLYHLILNAKQKDTFLKYDIDEEKIFQIPDFMHFDSPELQLQYNASPEFIDYLKDNCVYLNDELTYNSGNIDENTVFFLSNVRPVERKKIRTTIFLANQFKQYTKNDVAVVITHPNGDDVKYFKESIKFANDCDVQAIYLGDSLKLEKKNNNYTLNDVYKNMAALNTIGIVTSDKGGWENAINELIKAGIPVLMNPKLNSYRHIKDQMNIDVLGLPLDCCHEIINNSSAEDLKKSYAESIPIIDSFLQWSMDYCCISSKIREKYVKREYRKAYENLSSFAQIPKVQRLLYHLF